MPEADWQHDCVWNGATKEILNQMWALRKTQICNHVREYGMDITAPSFHQLTVWAGQQKDHVNEAHRCSVQCTEPLAQGIHRSDLISPTCNVQHIA